MYLSFEIKAVDLTSFLGHWSSKYSYADEYKYTNNIGNPLTKNSRLELFEWKNGTGSRIAAPKLKSIMENYPLRFDENKRKRYLNHKEGGGAIWNIFYLHCLEPGSWPIFDQHTYRAMYYIQYGKIPNALSTDKLKYEAYEKEYIPFVESLENTDHRAVDKALFAFGKFLKAAAKYT